MFLFEDWRQSHAAFRRSITTYFDAGYEWVAHYDIAAFYGSIDHRRLDQLLFPSGYENFRSLVSECLAIWSSSSPHAGLSHGIPQHLNASALVAELYLQHIDEQLVSSGVTYVRYVDDFRLFGRSREQVLEAVLLLTSLCQSAGLVPQTAKYKIFRAASADEARGGSASLSASDRHRMRVDAMTAAQRLRQALSSTPADGAMVRFVLGSATPNPNITAVVLENLAGFPDLADEFAAYLGQLSSDAVIARSVYENCLAVPSPYDYVEGVYWRLLSTFTLSTETRASMAREALTRLRQSGAARRPASRLGWYQFLCNSNNCSVLPLIAREPSTLIQMLAISAIRPKCVRTRAYRQMLDRLMVRADYEPALMAIAGMLSEGVPVTGTVPPAEDVSGVLANTLGLPNSIDSVDEMLRRRYGMAGYGAWQSFLTDDYDHARMVLFWADRSYSEDRNAWVNYTDTFNDIVFRKLIQVFSAKLPTANVPAVRTKKGLVDLGFLLNNAGDVALKQPSLVAAFQALHKVRSRSPASHAYEKRTAEQTRVVTGKEQHRLRRMLAKGYAELIVVLRAIV